MFTKRFQFEEVLNHWKRNGHTFVTVMREESRDESEGSSQIQANVRIYCLECQTSRHQLLEYTYNKCNPYRERLNRRRQAFFGEAEAYRCPHCGYLHDFRHEEEINLSQRTSFTHQVLGVSILSDLNERGFELLEYMKVRQPKKTILEELSGYQLFRYNLILTFEEQTLEILPIESKWDRAYLHLSNGLEVSYEQPRMGEISKIPKNYAFLDIYATRKSYQASEIFYMEAQNGPTLLNRTGLRNYIEAIQETKQQRTNQPMDFEDLIQVYRYERFRQEYPCVEQLAKCGYSTLIQQIIRTQDGRSLYNESLAAQLLDKHGTNPSRILNYPKAILKRLKALNVFESHESARVFQVLNQVTPLDLKFLNELGDGFPPKDLCYSTDLLINLHQLGYTYAELINYAKRAWLGQVLSPNDTWRFLRDYIRMAQMMGVEFDRFPRYLKVAHDLMQRNFKYKEDEFIQKQFERSVQQYEHLCYAPSNESFLITIPRKTEELVKEGNDLSHCVASYIKQVSEGKTMILFLRQKEDPSKPYITIEWQNNRVSQVRGYGNALLGNYPDAQKFFTKWTKHVEKLPQVKQLGSH